MNYETIIKKLISESITLTEGNTINGINPLMLLKFKQTKIPFKFADENIDENDTVGIDVIHGLGKIAIGVVNHKSTYLGNIVYVLKGGEYGTPVVNFTKKILLNTGGVLENNIKVYSKLKIGDIVNFDNPPLFARKSDTVKQIENGVITFSNGSTFHFLYVSQKFQHKMSVDRIAQPTTSQLKTVKEPKTSKKLINPINKNVLKISIPFIYSELKEYPYAVASSNRLIGSKVIGATRFGTDYQDTELKNAGYDWLHFVLDNKDKLDKINKLLEKHKIKIIKFDPSTVTFQKL